MSDRKLFDVRSEFFQQYFEKSLPFQEYIATGTPSQTQRWLESKKVVSFTDSQQLVLKNFSRKMNVLVLSGIWCGDCSRSCPIVASIAELCGCIDCRFIDNQQFAELSDELRIHGASRVPVVVTLSEDFFEISRFGDRVSSVYRSKVENELGPACDSGIGFADRSEVGDWVEHFARLHAILRLSPFLRSRYND